MVNDGWDTVTSIIVVLVAGLLFGLVQGAISTFMRIQAFVVATGRTPTGPGTWPDRLRQQTH